MKRAITKMTDEEREAEIAMIQRVLRECQHHEEPRLPEGSPVALICAFAAIMTCLGTALALSAWVF